MRRGLIIGALLVIAILAFMIYTFVTSLDGIVQAAIEEYGSQITKTEVRLAGAKVDPGKGEILLNGLWVGNPRGFRSDHSLALERAVVTMDISTITSGSVVINRILVEKPLLVYELGPDGSNLGSLKRNIQSQAKGSGKSPKGAGGKKGPKLFIDEIYVRGGKVALRTTLLGNREVTMSLPDLRLQDIGKGEGGATPERVAGQIAAALVKGVAAATRRAKLEKVLSGGGKDLERASRIIDKIHQGAGKDAREVGELLRRGAEENLKKLLR